MSSNRRSRLAGALAAALLLGGTTLPVAAQQAPGWLNWGSGTNEQSSGETNEDSASRSSNSSARTAPMPAASVAVADTGADPGNQSGQAVLLQRLMQRVNDLERQVQSMRGQLSEQERTLERQQRLLDEAAQSRPPQRASAPTGASPSVSADDPVAQDVPEEAVAAVDGEVGASAEASASDQADSNAGSNARETGGTASEDEQQALYNEAFEVLKSGKYEQAVDAFQKVIDANPEGSWAASAMFWQGETYYVQQDYAAAGKAYNELIERFPDSNRIPDAKLKLGYVAQERGDNDAARRVFNELVVDYPDSQAAGLAKQRLSRMGN